MKKHWLILLVLVYLCNALVVNVFGQSVNGCIQLPQSNLKSVLNDSLRKEFNLQNTNSSVYSYRDTAGQSFLIVSQNIKKVTDEKDTLYDNLRFINIRNSKKGFVKVWDIVDNIEKTNEINESSIWFWTKFAEFTDVDKDNFIDPIVVYGTLGKNGTDDGRVNIIVFYKGKKITIKHQNGIIEVDRITQIDEGFYKLPTVLQDQVKSIMKKIASKDLAAFPSNWEDSMKKHKLKLTEKDPGEAVN